MTRRHIPRSIVGAWGVQTDDGPMLNAITELPALFRTKAEAAKYCTLDDMRAVRVTVRYPLPRVRRA
jgi:hypothetical protein